MEDEADGEIAREALLEINADPSRIIRGDELQARLQALDAGPWRVEFGVAGLPAPKGSTRSFPHRVTGRMVTLPDAKGLRAWERSVELAARRAMAGRRPFCDAPFV